MVIFYSYIKLPDGNVMFHANPWYHINGYCSYVHQLNANELGPHPATEWKNQ